MTRRLKWQTLFPIPLPKQQGRRPTTVTQLKSLKSQGVFQFGQSTTQLRRWWWWRKCKRGLWRRRCYPANHLLQPGRSIQTVWSQQRESPLVLWKNDQYYYSSRTWWSICKGGRIQHVELQGCHKVAKSRILTRSKVSSSNRSFWVSEVILNILTLFEF